MLTLIHNNPARVENGRLRVDRKFHVGMQEYVRAIRSPLLTVHPESPAGAPGMDLIDIPLEELGYQVLILQLDKHGQPDTAGSEALRRAVAGSRIVVGYGYGAPQMAQRAGIPYILVLEYDLQTQLVVTRSHANDFARKTVRSLRTVWKYVGTDIPLMKKAHSIHCNGYPIYDEMAHFNDRRVLYLDSRMPGDWVITPEALDARLAQRGADRPLKLLYSGRYERMKGAVDAVKVAAECLRRGLNVEMHTYGQGSQRDEMRRIADGASRDGTPRIHIHDAITYPELARLAPAFDVFVCCHIQGDPSCTYLESFGAGLPVVGYDNRMWRRLQAESGAGFVGPSHDPGTLAGHVERLAADSALLGQLSHRARSFAAEHASEHEFARRTDALNAALAEAR